MSVKTIFKTLIGTIVVIILLSLCTELFNVNVSGTEIKTACTIATKQSAELFTQETYKAVGNIYADTEARTSNMKDIVAPDGTTYISGNFYGNGKTVSAIWSKLYNSSNSSFKAVCTLGQHESVQVYANLGGKIRPITYKCSYITDKNGSSSEKTPYPWAPYTNKNCAISIFKELGQLYAGIYDTANVNSASSTSVSFHEFTSTSSAVINKVNRKSYSTNAKRMKSSYYTPVNVGFPYFDAEVTNKIFQWELAMILTNNNPESIQVDENGKYYVNYKGFRCYVQDAYINEFDYYLVDTKREPSKLYSLVNISGSQLKHLSKQIGNNYVTVVGIKYTIPMSYQGITPLKRIVEYEWNTEVDGAKGGLYGDKMATDTSGQTGSGTISDTTTQSMTNKYNGTTGTGYNGALSSTGQVNYILIR